jgi:hypothetical protein
VLKVDREAVRAGSHYSQGLGFVDNPWGEKACQLGKTTCHLDDTHWGMIKEHAFVHISATGEESDEGIDDAGEAMNPHALIELDW